MPKFPYGKLDALPESDLQVAAGRSIGTIGRVELVIVAGEDGVEQDAHDSSDDQPGGVGHKRWV